MTSQNAEPVDESDAIGPSMLEYTVMSTPVSARPRIVGVVLLVISSSSSVPESLVARRSRDTGVDGAVASIVIVSTPESALGPLPNWSLCVAII